MQWTFVIFQYVIMVCLSYMEGRFSFLLVEEAEERLGFELRCVSVDNFTVVQFCKRVNDVAFGVIRLGSDLLFLRC